MWEQWNGLVWNSLDIVPFAWNIEELEKIPNLYCQGNIEPDVKVGLFVGVAIGLSRASEIEYKQLYGEQAKGSIKEDKIGFASQALYQHVKAYIALLGVEDATRGMNLLELEAEAAKEFDMELNKMYQK